MTTRGSRLAAQRADGAVAARAFAAVRPLLDQRERALLVEAIQKSRRGLLTGREALRCVAALAEVDDLRSRLARQVTLGDRAAALLRLAERTAG